jgi:hypothetical protein
MIPRCHAQDDVPDETRWAMTHQGWQESFLPVPMNGAEMVYHGLHHSSYLAFMSIIIFSCMPQG